MGEVLTKSYMVARAEVLGDTGANHPENWLGGLASPDLHAIVILFARDEEERVRCQAEHDKFIAQCDGVEVLSSLDLEATPPFDYAHDHFGYRDRMSQPVIEGSGEEPTPGSGAPLKAGEFILGYPDEDGPPANLPQPEILSRNGSYMAYRRLQEHVGAFRDFLKKHGQTPEEQELVAAKLMGRWRSGAPLVLSPDKDDPALGADPQRNNDFNYKQMDPHGYAVPLGSHMPAMKIPARSCSRLVPSFTSFVRIPTWFATGIYSLAPLSVFAGRSFMPDMASLALSIAGLYLFTCWLENEKSLSRFVAAWAATTLAILVKLPAIIIAVPMLYTAWRKYGAMLVRKRGMWAFAACSLLFPLTWYSYAYWLSLSHFPHHMFGSGGLETVSLDWYINIIQQAATSGVTPLASAAMLLGICLPPQTKFDRLFHWWLLAILVFMISTIHFRLPLVAIFCGLC